MLEILRHATDARPFRELEDEVYDLPELASSHQNAHVLSMLLVKAGALEQIPVEEPAAPQVADAEASDAEAEAALPDQPVDYLLRITPAGAAALEDFDPSSRYVRLMAQEPEAYRPLYRKVLDFCAQGATLPQIEIALANEEAMRTPKLIYPSYFVSKLESLGTLRWEDGLWKTTSDGASLAAAL